MAIIQTQVVNPTAAPITVNSHTAAPNAITVLGLDNTTADAETFLAQGCALVSDAAGTVVQREQAGFLIYTGAASTP